MSGIKFDRCSPVIIHLSVYPPNHPTIHHQMTAILNHAFSENFTESRAVTVD